MSPKKSERESEHEYFIRRCKDRLDMGAKQYGDLTYLDRSFTEHIAEIQDELIDVGNYAFMLWHKFKKLDKRIIENPEGSKSLIFGRSPARLSPE